MPQPISIPPLIPLPAEARAGTDQTTTHDAQEDLFSTLFSPSTPRASPTLGAAPDEESAGAARPGARPVHSRTASVDSDFGSFVSVPSAEDPLRQAGPDSPFAPLQKGDFFDQFAEEATAATARNQHGVLDELLNHENDPLHFLRSEEPAPPPAVPRSASSTERASVVDDSLEQPLITLEDSANDVPRSVPVQSGHTSPHLVPSTATTRPRPPPDPPRGLLHEILTHEDDPMYFHYAARSAHSSRTPTPQPPGVRPAQGPQHSSREPNHTEPQETHPPGHPARSPSLPPTPMQPSQPEVQKAQSFFVPSSFTAAAFPTRWVSSLLSRPAPPAARRGTPPPPAEGLPVHARAGAAPGGLPITHGTPFAAHTYAAPSGAPGFAGDRAWDKGFAFDQEHAARPRVQLAGRKEGTRAVLRGAMADALRAHLPALLRLPRAWTLLYSLEQHGISLHTLYARCAAHAGGALVVVRDANDAVFGAWMGEGVRVSRGAYYGSGESFLWKWLPEEKLRVYKWTGRNDYVALCEPEYISFGGGDGHYGLYLDETLSDGSSARCPTFDNEPLCSPGPRQGENVTFECVGLEVWGIGG